MDQQKFSLWVLILTIGLMQWYYTVSKHFGGEAQMKVSLEQMKVKLEQEKLQHALARHELQEFKQEVAAIIPELEDADQSSDQIRNLASIVVNPNLDKIKIERASTLFERGKTKFREGEYEQSNRIFQTLIQRHPDSLHVVESYFFFANGAYKEKEYEEVLKTVDSMVSLFPENDYTGYALILMGRILADRDRVEDAEQIYRTVIENFKNEDLNKQANTLLKEITL